MRTGIVVCGLNGAGKSTLGKTLAKKLGFHFIDSEDLYFPKTSPDNLYAFPRTRKEVETLLLREIKAHENFVFASVTGDYEAVDAFCQCAVLIEVPKQIRMQRVKNRSFQTFGYRMLAGGDLQEQEEAFFRFVQSRRDDIVEEWARTLRCPILRVDGTKPLEENVNFLIAQIQIF